MGLYHMQGTGVCEVFGEIRSPSYLGVWWSRLLVVWWSRLLVVWWSRLLVVWWSKIKNFKANLNIVWSRLLVV